MKMRLPSFAYAENLKVAEEPTPEPIPDDVSIPELAEQVARGKRKVSPQQMRMLVELLPYYSPKLTAVAVGHLTSQDFYSRLDRAVERSDRARLIEGRVVEQVDDD
jgi:hypothetical protein